MFFEQERRHESRSFRNDRSMACSCVSGVATKKLSSDVFGGDGSNFAGILQARFSCGASSQSGLFGCPMTDETFQAGDSVTITCGDRVVPGWIMMASKNGASLMLGFEAMLDGHVGMMPVLREADGYRSIMNGVLVTIERRQS